MAPRKPTATTATRLTSRSRKDGSAKRAREPDAPVSDAHPKRQRTSTTTAELLIQAQSHAHRAHAATHPPSHPQPAAQRPGSTAPILNHPPLQHLNVYVMGANSGAELGLGPGVKSGNVRLLRPNPYLSGPAGVVQISLGAMHGVALTADNRILTWGVNDHGALGRDTTWEPPLVDADGSDGDGDDDDDGDDGDELNPRESTPTQVDMSAVPPDTIFTQVAAADNATFALTNTGRVYGWGAFRVRLPVPLPVISMLTQNRSLRTAN